tara:strand:- start:45207 stop:46025 length:819 start_codon:yes stop_codon:yes gene_type:complete
MENLKHNRLEGKSVIVTGAGSGKTGYGIGQAIAVLFARQGAKVLVVDVNKERGERTVDAILDNDGIASFYLADILNSNECKNVIERVIASYGNLDVLINNVGVSGIGSVTDLDETQYKNVIDTNLSSMVLMSKYAIPRMIENGGGSILNMSSFVALRSGGFGPAIPYALSKAGIMALTQQMCHDHGPDGIRVNCIAPGHIYTPMVENRVDQKLRDLRRKAAPLQTEGTAWDIAWAALFLSSDEARWISGVTLPVDAGLLTASPLSMLDKLTN